MKNEILNTKEKIILLYNISGERLEIIKSLCSEHNVRIIMVEDRETFCKVEDLILRDTKSCIESDAESLDIEFLLFVNMINDDLYGFIGELKKKNLYFPNKAILTNTNLHWKFRRLLMENKEEHIVMTMFTNLRRAMKKAQIIVDNNKYDDELLKIMENAKHFLNPREFDFDEMKEIHNKLANKVNELS